MDESLLRFDEKIIYRLRALYKKYGYLPYKMSKFEEYELYIRNKDFLISDRVIAFNDTNGKMMALKPDVTLSIIKNGEDRPGVKQKVFYNENVYRVSESTRRFKEILQTGLECIGDVDDYDIYEVISLAAGSLCAISDRFCLEISNMDMVRDVIASVLAEPLFEEKVLFCISEKNLHDLKKVCDDFSVGKEGYETISLLISLCGERKGVLAKLKPLCSETVFQKLTTLSALLDASPYSEKIRFDFSIVNDMNYYNGFVFTGFIDGVCNGVLAGGQYDKMMTKMNRACGAVGFALYLDRLEDCNRDECDYDVDYLLLYDEKTDIFTLSVTVDKLIAAGATVSAQKDVPEKLRYRKLTDLRNREESPC